ncbi:MAG: NERD domain-containing protein [Methylophaga sp.]|nr:NERD domain-containing protein [Methylophaga sp.]
MFDSIPYYYHATAGLLLLLLLWLVYRRFRHVHAPSRAIDEILKPYQRDEVKNLIIPDGMGGLIEIERLVLIDQGLLVIETYPLSGHLFGADHIEQWTQIIDGKSFKFSNPLRHCHNIRESLLTLVPKTPVFCRVVFTADSNFPKGKPYEASVIATLADDLAPIFEQVTAPRRLDDAWQRIIRIGRKDEQTLVRE